MMGQPAHQEKPAPGLIWLRRRVRQALRFLTGCCNLCLDFMDVLLRVLGPLLVVLAVSLISFVAYTFFTVLIPYFADGGTPLPLLLAELALGCFLLVNLLYNYAMAICLNAGTPPESAGDSAKDAELGVVGFGCTKECQKCFRSKPPRAHHCSVCKRCVLKMDHHCPWINNCVGFNNYRYFCLFMLYLALGCLYVVVMGYHLFLRSVVPLRRRPAKMSFADAQCMTLSWLISLCIFLALCLLGGFHLYLVLTNQTTIEFHVNLTNRHLARRKGESYRNPYDLGWSRNFQQVFGPNKFFHFLWMMPYLAKRPNGDGCSFPSMCELEA
ncbi:unnamed protein product [Effrenium voratum]|nr:unnamed protein product [Effrenium voratum]CAJ1452367.1 unnamed protein product [Effrenium voratum]|mmetsp:Transcript_29019/g.69078  ORF Transcript_29019/g.69078 Transcript_29019/m.69078 type:complete len:326 (+) Transcript_29019:50-1027(+)